jgi:ABC-type transport system involved in cytochrome c biogenesis ATPase subunit
MSIKGKLIKKNTGKEYKIYIIEGNNGSGKTTILKRKINNWKNLNNFLWSIYYTDIKKKKVFTVLEKFNIKNIKIIIEFLTILNIPSNFNILKFDDFSSGQKKKLFLAILLSSKSILWHIDEPQNYLDDLSYILLKKIINKQLTLTGRITLSKNSKIEKHTYIVNKISLSRFELLTPHLSNECSTTEL